MDLTKVIRLSKELSDELAKLLLSGHPSVEFRNPLAWRDKLIATAREGLKASWSESAGGYCSRWVRQVVERSFGYKDHELVKYFGADAVETGKKLRALGLVPNHSRLVPGDILLQEVGSEGNGHIGIYLGSDEVAENSTRRGPDGRGVCTLKEFGKITGVARLEDITKK